MKAPERMKNLTLSSDFIINSRKKEERWLLLKPAGECVNARFIVNPKMYFMYLLGN